MDLNARRVWNVPNASNVDLNELRKKAREHMKRMSPEAQDDDNRFDATNPDELTERTLRQLTLCALAAPLVEQLFAELYVDACFLHALAPTNPLRVHAQNVLHNAHRAFESDAVTDRAPLLHAVHRASAVQAFMYPFYEAARGGGDESVERISVFLRACIALNQYGRYMACAQLGERDDAPIKPIAVSYADPLLCWAVVFMTLVRGDLPFCAPHLLAEMHRSRLGGALAQLPGAGEEEGAACSVDRNYLRSFVAVQRDAAHSATTAINVLRHLSELLADRQHAFVVSTLSLLARAQDSSSLDAVQADAEGSAALLRVFSQAPAPAFNARSGALE